MSWKSKILGLVKKYGAGAKFAVSTVLNTVLPGSTAVIELIEKAFDSAANSAQDDWEKHLADDLNRVGKVVDLLAGDLDTLLTQVAALQALPDAARQILEVSLAADDRVRTAVHRLTDLAGDFDVLRRQQQEMLERQSYAVGMIEEMLPLLRRMQGVADFVDDLKAAGMTASDPRYRERLHAFQQGARRVAAGAGDAAVAGLQALAEAEPQSAAAQVALAAAQTADRQLHAAQKTLIRAARLRPQDAGLADLQRRATRAGGGDFTPSPVGGGGAAVPRGPRVGDVLDGWQLEQLLGQGGWGQVFRAVRAGQVRALKVMHPELARDPAFGERFRREIGTLFGLKGNKHLVEIHDFGKADELGCWYFVMEFVEGATLERYLAQRGPLTAGQARKLFAAVAEGLATAHARGIVHRDVKPANILLRTDGSPVLVDFGLGAFLDGQGPTRTGSPSGMTVMFAAPEQLRGKPADQRSDVFALGATLYYALTYDRPDVREPDSFDPEHVPEALRAICRQAMEHKPLLRYAHAAAFRDGLLGSNLPPPPLKQPPPLPPPAPPKKERQPGDIVTNALGMKLAWIPPGSFLMGSPASEAGRLDDETQHRVTLTKGFFMGVYPVTQAQWRAVMGNNPSHFKGDDRPVEQVSWDDCQEFCKKLSAREGRTYRLPTEAEWEYACRANTTTPFSFGETITTDQVNYDGNYLYGKGKKGQYRQQTTPVGTFPANAWGLCDMHGNVWDWCQDWFGEYPKGYSKDPQGDSNGKYRVLRGGAWGGNPEYCRAGRRDGVAPASRYCGCGCRVCFLLD